MAICNKIFGLRSAGVKYEDARSFHVARWSLETGTSIPVSPLWTRATGRKPFAINRDRFGKVSCGHGLTQCSQSNNRNNLNKKSDNIAYIF